MKGGIGDGLEMVSAIRLTREFDQEFGFVERLTCRGFHEGDVPAHCVNRRPFIDVSKDCFVKGFP